MKKLLSILKNKGAATLGGVTLAIFAVVFVVNATATPVITANKYEYSHKLAAQPTKENNDNESIKLTFPETTTTTVTTTTVPTTTAKATVATTKATTTTKKVTTTTTTRATTKATVATKRKVTPATTKASTTKATTKADATKSTTKSTTKATTTKAVSHYSNDIKTVSTLLPPAPIELDSRNRPVNYKKVVTGKGSAYYETGLTATGKKCRPGYVAVDPKKIPYGTKMFIITSSGDYIYGYASAEDTGGFVKWSNPRIVDLFFPSESQCQSFGVRNVEIYILN